MKKVVKKLGIVGLVWIATFPAIAQQIVTSTNANGAGSLADAINNSPAGGTITFNIGGTGPFVINTILPQINKALTIDATSQTGYTQGQPIVILRGTSGAGNGFDVTASNVTIRGFIIQNFQSGYYQASNVSGNTIEGCWFGLDATGTSTTTANTKLNGYGVEIRSGTVTIGSNDGAVAKRNVIAGCGLGGVIFGTLPDGPGAGSGSLLGNTFIGTDATGTVSSPTLGNGTGPLETEYRHGVLVVHTLNLTIRNNVISGNRSGGIDIFGASSGAVIAGNKIGTDVTGLKPLGNNTFGIRIRGSNNHTIGGSTLADRNIVSANGSSTFPNEQNTSDPTKFDWYNACGIYLNSCSTSTIAGNYIGVDATGNRFTLTAPYDFGNFYVGIKIEGISNNNRVGLPGAGNVIGGNGFRSGIAAANFDGHGIIIKDKGTTNTSIVGNYVGVGIDGISPTGNKQDGISLQGCISTIIGGATAGERNIIGDNTWGIFISSNYWDSQALDIKIYGNYVGTDATGTVAIGNGTRAGLNSGGGIGVIHFTQRTLVGGNIIGQGNVISGNRTGLALGGGSVLQGPIAIDAGKGSTGAKVYGNLIGVAADGTTILKNNKHGLYISQKANANEIGGALAGQGNKIIGNDSSGINSSNGIGNIFKGNTITNNGRDGIALYSGSSSNIIGGVTSGEGNFIENNSGNGIFISGASSNNNSIHKNKIACNTLRGIELNGSGNGNYSKPTYSGTPSTIVVTGPVGSFIELFELDGCNTCGTGTNLRLQGRKLRASGPSPLTFAGSPDSIYTATASAGSTSTAHNTSEFSDCYSICTPPTINIPVIGSTVCKGENGRVTVLNAQNIPYQAFIGSNPVGPIAIGSNGVANLLVYADSLKAPSNTILVKGRSVGAVCGFVSLDSLALIIVNTPPKTDSDITANGPVCIGTRGTLTVATPERGYYYQVFEGNTSLSDSIISTGTSPLPLLLSLLAPGTHTLRVKVGVSGCTPTFLSKQVPFVVDSIVKKDLVVRVTTPICLGSNAIVTIENSEIRKTYTVFEKLVSLATGSGNGGNLSIPVSNLGEGSHQFSIFVTVPGCQSDTLNQKPTVQVNSVPDSTLTVGTNGPVCGGNQALFLIFNAQAGKSYKIFSGSDPVSRDTLGNGGTLAIRLFNLAPGSYSLRAVASAAGCAQSIELRDGATITINRAPNTEVDATVNGPVCAGNPAIVTVIKPEKGKTYSVYYGSQLVGDTVTSNGADSLKISIRTLLIPTGSNRALSIAVEVPGCIPDTLLKKPLLTINEGVQADSHTVAAVPSVICVNTDGLVRVTGTVPNARYQAYVNEVPVGQEATTPGSSLEILIPANVLSPSWNTITVKIFVAGCGFVNLRDTAGIKVNPNPNLDLGIEVAPSIICRDGTSLLTISSSGSGVSYQAQLENGTKIGEAEIGKGGAVRLLLTGIPVGDNQIFVGASIGGCISRVLDSSVVVKVNDGTTTNYDVKGDTVCKGNAGIVQLSGSKIGVAYFVVIKSSGKTISDTIPGTGVGIGIPLDISNNPIDTVQVFANVPGCGPIALEKSTLVVTNDNSTSQKLPTRGSTACASEQTATATVVGARPGILYTAYKKEMGVLLASGMGNGSDLVLDVPTQLLSSGRNEIYFVATVPGCVPVPLDSNAFVYLIGGSINIQGKGLVCFLTEGLYRIDPIPGVSLYKWTVTGGALILSGDSTNEIIVKFGQQNSTISLLPVGSVGSCQLTNSEIDVAVEQPLASNISIVGPDTVCVNDTRRIWVDSTSIAGVDRIDWTWASGTEVVNILNRQSVFPLFDVQFAQTGLKQIIAIPHERCSDTFKRPDTLLVKVLGYPVAEAGSYPLIQDFSSAIPLDGSGSSRNGAPPADTLAYGWMALDKNLEINNPNSLLGATFKPSDIQTWVYLTVTNLGRCSVKDSAFISTKPLIDIPNVFSPNNDGTHDFWEIKNLNMFYPNASVEIFNKWGSQVYKSNGYSKPWDGTRNGEDLPVATYYYVIDLKDETKPKVASVTIIR